MHAVFFGLVTAVLATHASSGTPHPTTTPSSTGANGYCGWSSPSESVVCVDPEAGGVKLELVVSLMLLLKVLLVMLPYLEPFCVVDGDFFVPIASVGRSSPSTVVLEEVFWGDLFFRWWLVPT